MEWHFLTWIINGDRASQKRIFFIIWKKTPKIQHYLFAEDTNENRYKIFVLQIIWEEFISTDLRKKSNGDVVFKKLVLSDEHGKFVRVQIQSSETKKLVLGLYAPNEDKGTFYKHLMDKRGFSLWQLVFAHWLKKD